MIATTLFSVTNTIDMTWFSWSSSSKFYLCTCTLSFEIMMTFPLVPSSWPGRPRNCSLCAMVQSGPPASFQPLISVSSTSLIIDYSLQTFRLEFIQLLGISFKSFITPTILLMTCKPSSWYITVLHVICYKYILDWYGAVPVKVKWTHFVISCTYILYMMLPGSSLCCAVWSVPYTHHSQLLSLSPEHAPLHPTPITGSLVPKYYEG